MTDTTLRYSRQIALPAVGPEGQARLATARVLIIGAGGLGSPASLYLASAGIGQLQISDFDSIDATNLPRQILYTEQDTGLNKATVAAARLRTANPAAEVTAQTEKLTPAMLEDCLKDVDAVLDCTDNFVSRWQINRACFATGVALISGAAIRWEGQVTVFRHDLKTGPCYRCLYSEADENLHDCAGQGIMAPVAGTVGTIMATETLKLLLGIDSGLQGKLWVYDGLAGNSRTISIPKQPDCPVCSQ